LSKNTYQLPFKIGLTAAEEVLPIFSATILDFEMSVEGTYIYLKETILHFAYRFGASIKENRCATYNRQVQCPHNRNAIPMHSKNDK
jgi:hypothetical protein